MRFVDESFVPTNQQTRVLYCRLSDFRSGGLSVWSKYTKGCSIKGIISQHLLVPNCAYRNETNEKVTFSRQYELMAVLPKVHTLGEFVE